MKVVTRSTTDAPFEFSQSTTIAELNSVLGGSVQLGHVTNDGNTIYFQAFQFQETASWPAYVATRGNADEPFGQVSLLNDGEQLVEYVTANGLIMFSWSDSSAGLGEADLFMSSRSDTAKEFGPSANLGPIVNSASDETFPFFHELSSTLYFTSDRPGTIVSQESPFPSAEPVRDIWQSKVSFPGDFDFDHAFTSADIDSLGEAIRNGQYHFNLDTNHDGHVDLVDHSHWVHSELFANTHFGDSNLDGTFDSLDLVEVLTAGEYDDDIALNSTWNEGDWSGDGDFDRSDVVAALQDGAYSQGASELQRAIQPTGRYRALQPGGLTRDGQTSVVYNAGSGEVAVDAPAGIELTSINIDSARGIFTGEAAQKLGGSFDNDADSNIFKATFGGSFGSVGFGPVAQAGLSEQFVLGDLSVVGSLSGGGDLGNVDLVYVPEPSTIGLVVCVLLVVGIGRIRGKHV